MKYALRIIVWASAAVFAFALQADAQTQVVPPAGPLTVCFTQPPPAADSYQLIFDGAAPEAVTTTAPVAGCQSGSTHAISVPASKFTVGTHTIVIRATNAFGATDSDPHTVVVGIRPGKPTIGGVVTPEG